LTAPQQPNPTEPHAAQQAQIKSDVTEVKGDVTEVKSELSSITEAIGILVDHIDQSLPEERVKQLADAVLAEERSGRRRLMATVGGALLIIIFLAASSLIQSHSNGKTLNEAKTVSDYVKHCLVAPPPHDPTNCGADSSAAFIKGLIGSLNCSLLIPPAARTEEKLNACATKAFGN
jgi:hypothetical protein